jgi:hypothetical protein
MAQAIFDSDSESDYSEDDLSDASVPSDVPAQTIGPTKKWDAFQVRPFSLSP